jgi:hypothetical protein
MKLILHGFCLRVSVPFIIVALHTVLRKFTKTVVEKNGIEVMVVFKQARLWPGWSKFFVFSRQE